MKTSVSGEKKCYKKSEVIRQCSVKWWLQKSWREIEVWPVIWQMFDLSVLYVKGMETHFFEVNALCSTVLGCDIFQFIVMFIYNIRYRKIFIYILEMDNLEKRNFDFKKYNTRKDLLSYIISTSSNTKNKSNPINLLCNLLIISTQEIYIIF